jgi:hypothetical protein
MYFLSNNNKSSSSLQLSLYDDICILNVMSLINFFETDLLMVFFSKKQEFETKYFGLHGFIPRELLLLTFVNFHLGLIELAVMNTHNCLIMQNISLFPFHRFRNINIYILFFKS